MEETNDQAQAGTEVSEEVAEATDSTQQASEKQSETTEEDGTESESKAYTIPVLGKDVTPDELYEEYKKTQAEITRLQQEKAQREAKIKEEVDTSLSKSELLENVDPNVKEALSYLIRQEATNLLEEREIQAAQKAADKAFDRKLEELEKRYSGKEGLPKFDRRQIITAMQDPGNDIFDPEIKFMLMHKDVFDDYLIKQALKNKSGGPKTETSTGSTPAKPSGKEPGSWEEAAKSAFSRI